MGHNGNRKGQSFLQISRNVISPFLLPHQIVILSVVSLPSQFKRYKKRMTDGKLTVSFLWSLRTKHKGDIFALISTGKTVSFLEASHRTWHRMQLLPKCFRP